MPRKALLHFAVVLGSYNPVGEVFLVCFPETLLPLRSFQRMLSNQRKVPVPMAGGWNLVSFKVPSNLNHSGIL